MNLLSPDSVFRRALCAQVCPSFNIKTPKLWRENRFSVSAAPISPAKIHLVIFRIFFSGYRSTVEVKSCPLLLFSSLQPEILLLIASFKKWDRWENSSCGRASFALDSCSWTLVDSSSRLTPMYRVQVLILLLFPFTVWGLISFLSTPLFTHSPSITPHQTVLGEFISVYNMLWSCPNNGDVTLLHFYRLFYLKIKVVSYDYHDWIIAA